MINELAFKQTHFLRLPWCMYSGIFKMPGAMSAQTVPVHQITQEQGFEVIELKSTDTETN